MHPPRSGLFRSWRLACAAGWLAGLAACGGGSPDAAPRPVVAAVAKAGAVGQPRALGPNVVANPGFEAGAQGWTVHTERATAFPGAGWDAAPASVIQPSTPAWPAYAGTASAVLGNAIGNRRSLTQTVRVPDDAPRAGLQFRFFVRGTDTQIHLPTDTLEVQLLHAATGERLATLGTITSVDRLPEANDWQPSPLYDLTAFRGQTVQLRFLSTNPGTRVAGAFMLDEVHVGALDVEGVVPQTGWWWNPAQPGRGFAIEHQNGALYIAGFLYTDIGPSGWIAGTLQRHVGGAFAGNLAIYYGGQSLHGDFQAPEELRVLHKASIVFSADDQATLAVSLTDGTLPQAIALQRFAFAGRKPPAAAFASGWWWNPDEPGRGTFIEVQGDQVFAASFLYRTDGHGVWYTQQGTVGAGPSFTLPLREFRDGQPLFGAWRAATPVLPWGPPMAFQADSANTGSLVVGGRRTPVRRFVFN